jgi:hypothetical protein
VLPDGAVTPETLGKSPGALPPPVAAAGVGAAGIAAVGVGGAGVAVVGVPAAGVAGAGVLALGVAGAGVPVVGVAGAAVPVVGVPVVGVPVVGVAGACVPAVGVPAACRAAAGVLGGVATVGAVNAGGGVTVFGGVAVGVVPGLPVASEPVLGAGAPGVVAGVVGVVGLVGATGAKRGVDGGGTGFGVGVTGWPADGVVDGDAIGAGAPLPGGWLEAGGWLAVTVLGGVAAVVVPGAPVGSEPVPGAGAAVVMGFGSDAGGAGIIGSAGGLPGDGVFLGGVTEGERLFPLSAPGVGVTIGPAFTSPVDADVPLTEGRAGRVGIGSCSPPVG